MAIYGAAFELQMVRHPAGANINPDMGRIYRSNSSWTDTSGQLRTQLSRGTIPYPASGRGCVAKRVTGVATNSAGQVAIDGFGAALLADFAYVDGALTASSSTFIRRCGWGGQFTGAGRPAGGDFVSATGDLADAINGLGTAEALMCEVYASQGATDDVGDGINPWVTGPNNQSYWQSHLGIYDFVDSENLTPRCDELYLKIKSNQASCKLPNGVTVYDCNFAALTPDAQIYASSVDIGGAGIFQIPQVVTSNSADLFRNHPGVFLRSDGAPNVRSVVQRWRDQYVINAFQLGQPFGLTSVSADAGYSSWLVVIDGEAEVVVIKHPPGLDVRRPVDIWNKVIVALIAGSESDTKRISTYNLYGEKIGTESKWNYLSYARYIGRHAGDVTQTNADPPPG